MIGVSLSLKVRRTPCVGIGNGLAGLYAQTTMAEGAMS